VALVWKPLGREHSAQRHNAQLLNLVAWLEHLVDAARQRQAPQHGVRVHVCRTRAGPHTVRRKVWLRGRLDQPLEPAALRVHAAAPLLGDAVDWQIHVALVHLPDSGSREPGHCPVDGVLRQCRAVLTVKSVCWHRPYHIRGVDVFDRQRQAQLLEAVRNRALQPQTDVGQHLVPARVPLAAALDHGVATALGYNDDCVPFRPHQVLDVHEHLLGVDAHLGQQADVRVPRREHSVHGDEAAVPAHQFDKADAVCVASRLDIGRVHRLDGLCGSCVKPEGLIQHGHVVVNGLGHADHSTLVVDL